jgi:uridylate kinase
LAVVVGGGNFWRGLTGAGAQLGLYRAHAAWLGHCLGLAQEAALRCL